MTRTAPYQFNDPRAMAEWSHENFMTLSENHRRDMALHLRAHVPTRILIKWRDSYLKHGTIQLPDERPNHLTEGMTVRNLLRQVLPDEELPPILYPWVNQLITNWDDYYLGAMIELVKAHEHENFEVRDLDLTAEFTQ